jgi:hypothetical protein
MRSFGIFAVEKRPSWKVCHINCRLSRSRICLWIALELDFCTEIQIVPPLQIILVLRINIRHGSWIVHRQNDQGVRQTTLL